MSLVSYADSDDSSEEEVEQPEVQKKEAINKNKVVKFSPTSLPVGTTEVQKKETKQEGDDHEKTKPKSIGGLFSSLPSPWMSSVSWANKSSAKGSFIGRNKKEQTVKITVPSFDHNSDSDEEESKSTRKTTTLASQKPSGLFSLLPKPKYSVVVKENNPNRPVEKISNRPLIPDSLRRKQAKKPTPRKVKEQAKKTESDDDSDDETGGSFFSLNEPTSSQANDASTSQVITDVSEGPNVDKANERTVDMAENMLLSTSCSSSSSTTMIPPNLRGEAQVNRNIDSVQDFSQADNNSSSEHFENQNYYTVNNSQGYSYGTTPLGYSSGYQTDNVGFTEQNYPYTNYEYFNSEQYNPATTQQEQTDWQAPAQPSTEEAPDEFKKFLGKRGREENINIIDVNADDQKDSSQSWRSNYQKEDEYKPQSKKKGNLPSSQQRRKHQITYLAFQAKEKEWELRNQWSANSQTRRQTQSKYGF